MNNIRIIPKLEIKNENLVKGINFEGLRVLGNPIYFINEYVENLADEIFIQDLTASLYDIRLADKFIQKISKNVFIPIMFGGGIKSLNDINKLLKLGIDKFSINTSALKNPYFIRTVANQIGSSNISISIEAKKIKNEFYAYGEMGRYNSGKKVNDWIDEVITLGAGEIVLNSIDHDGTGNGFDYNLLDIISKKKN